MKLSDFLSPERVLAKIESSSKKEALEEIAQFICETELGASLTAKQLFNAIMDREELGSTGIGDGVAIPHAKIDGLENLCASFVRSTEGVQYDSIDSQPVRLIFVLLVPENSAGLHLKALARISRVLKDREFRDELIAAGTSRELYDLFIRQDNQN